jgi:hypothetical protein
MTARFFAAIALTALVPGTVESALVTIDLKERI